MAKEIRNIGASVRARLQNLSRETGENFELILTRYALERLLYRLSTSAYAERFVLKGATLLTSWFADPHRATRDLDLLGFGDPNPDTMIAAFREILYTPSRSRAAPAAALRTSLAGHDDESPATRADLLLNVLTELRQSDQPNSERYETLRHCRAFASQLRADLTRQFVGLSLPPPAEQIILSRRCADAYRLLSDCFRGIAEEIARQDAGPLADTNRFVDSCYRGIECLGEYIVIRCECYLKASKGIWLDVHRLHDMAVLEGVEQLPLDGGDASSARTIESAYKRLLLLGLSDPFQHPFRGVRRLYEKLDGWSALTYLTRAEKPATRCVFVVDPWLDRPATPVLSQTRLRAELNQRWFVTRELVTRLKQEYDTAVNHSAEHFQRSEFPADELGSVDFLRRLIVRWSIHPVRAGQRRRTFRNCDLVVGLKTVCLALNGFRPLYAEDPDAVTGVRRMITGTYGRAEAESVDSAYIRDGWEIEDESANGLKLVRRDRPADNFGVAIDDLVAVKSGQGQDWSVGTAHWVQTDESGSVSMGVRLIPQPMRPVLIDQLHVDSVRVRSEALLLADKSDGGLTRSLICPASIYYPTGTYLVQLPGGRGEFVVEATNMLLSSRSLVWFELTKPRADSAQKVLDLINPH